MSHCSIAALPTLALQRTLGSAPSEHCVEPNLPKPSLTFPADWSQPCCTPPGSRTLQSVLIPLLRGTSSHTSIRRVSSSSARQRKEAKKDIWDRDEETPCFAS